MSEMDRLRAEVARLGVIERRAQACLHGSTGEQASVLRYILSVGEFTAAPDNEPNHERRGQA